MKKFRSGRLSVMMMIILGIALFSVCFLVYFRNYIAMGLAIIKWSHDQDNCIRRLLYETDHKALREACVSVINEARQGKWEFKKQYMIRTNRDPNATRLPDAILPLNPAYIWIEKDQLSLTMMGGMAHCGAIAYSPDSTTPDSESNYGDKKLVDGLWYFDVGLKEHPSYYEKHLESLRPKKK